MKCYQFECSHDTSVRNKNCIPIEKVSLFCNIIIFQNISSDGTPD